MINGDAVRRSKTGQQSVFVEDIAFLVYMDRLHLANVNAVYRVLLADDSIREQFAADVQKIQALSTGRFIAPDEANTLQKQII